jgi:hypothetical protein
MSPTTSFDTPQIQLILIPFFLLFQLNLLHLPDKILDQILDQVSNQFVIGEAGSLVYVFRMLSPLI